MKTSKTFTHTDGNTCPYVALDISSASHPAYTGEVRKEKADGRIAGFKQCFTGYPGEKRA